MFLRKVTIQQLLMGTNVLTLHLEVKPALFPEAASLNWRLMFMGEGRSHQEDAEISCCPGVGTAKADTFTLF